MHHYSEKMQWWQIILATLFFMLILSIPVMSLVGLIANENAEARTEAPNVEIIEDVIENKKEPEQNETPNVLIIEDYEMPNEPYIADEIDDYKEYLRNKNNNPEVRDDAIELPFVPFD